MQLISVKYVGKRPFYTDGTFGTRVYFLQGESKLIPEDKARLMLKHPDVYVPGSANAPVAAVPQAQEPSEDLQDLRDAVAAMGDKSALSDFTQARFGIKLDKRKPIEDLRLQAIGMIDQYGVPQ